MNIVPNLISSKLGSIILMALFGVHVLKGFTLPHQISAVERPIGMKIGTDIENHVKSVGLLVSVYGESSAKISTETDSY